MYEMYPKSWRHQSAAAQTAPHRRARKAHEVAPEVLIRARQERQVPAA